MVIEKDCNNLKTFYPRNYFKWLNDYSFVKSIKSK